MLTIGVIFLSIAILITVFVAYYFLYQRYLNKRLVGECRKKHFPHPMTTVFCLILLFSIMINVALCIERNKMLEQNFSLQGEINHMNRALHITEFDAKSPYLHYKDIIMSGDSNGYQISHSESNGFHFYFAESVYQDTAIYYPSYICYIKCDNVLEEDTDITIKYIYDENNSQSTTGEMESEIMLLSRSLEQLPQEITIMIRERDSKLEEGNLIVSASFTVHS